MSVQSDAWVTYWYMVTGPRLRNSVCIALKSIDQSHGIKSKMKKKASTVTCLELIITVLLFFILNYRLTFTGLDSEFFFFFWIYNAIPSHSPYLGSVWNSSYLAVGVACPSQILANKNSGLGTEWVVVMEVVCLDLGQILKIVPCF